MGLAWDLTQEDLDGLELLIRISFGHTKDFHGSLRVLKQFQVKAIYPLKSWWTALFFLSGECHKFAPGRIRRDRHAASRLVFKLMLWNQDSICPLLQLIRTLLVLICILGMFVKSLAKYC